MRDRRSMRQYVPIGLVLIAFLIIGSLYAFFTPDWQAPDEPAHYNYIRQLASGRLPIIEQGDYDQAYQNLVISSQFDPQYPVVSFEYEDYQPPLYYLLQTPIYLVTGGSLDWMRLFSVLLGAGVVLLSYLVVLALFPGRTWLALIAAIFVAFLPQHVAMMAAINNDALAELLIAGILLLLLYIILSTPDGNGLDLDSFSSSARWKWLLIGVLLGLGFLTKVTVYLLVPAILLVQFWLYRGRRPLLIRGLMLVFTPALVLGLIWWIRNIVVYDSLDPVGNLAHNTIVVGQPRTAEWLANSGTFVFLKGFIQTTFQSFWGQFGWMGVPMPTWVYIPLAVFTILVGIGLIWHLFQTRDRVQNAGYESDASKPKRASFVLLLGVFLLSAAAYIAYNVTFVQHQGRYLFPALIPISLGVAVGIAALMKPLTSRWPNAVYLLPLLFAVALIMLDLLALFRFIVPSLT